MTCVDWLSTLRPASWRGVHFWVEHDELTVGRRLVVHEFPNRDRPFVEDLGEKAVTFNVTAYVASDSAIAEKNSLLNACRQRGAGTLVLPTEGSQRARCKTARRTHEKDRLGYIAFSLEFVEAGQGLAASAIPMAERLVEAAAGTAVGAIALAFLQEFQTIRRADFVQADAAAVIQDWSEYMEVVRSHMTMSPAAKAALGRAIADYHRDAALIAHDGRDTVDVRQTRLGLASLDQPSGEAVTRASAILEQLRDGATSEVDAFEALEEASAYGRDDITWTAYGDSGRQQLANRRAMLGAYRRLALVHMGVVGARIEWADRSQAVYARATVAELFDAELGTIAAGSQAYEALAQVRNGTAQALSQRIADMDPVVTVESSAVMPSLVWAWRLYGDANQALDLATRNDINHPGFMPLEFEALTPLNDETPDHASDRRRRANGG